MWLNFLFGFLFFIGLDIHAYIDKKKGEEFNHWYLIRIAYDVAFLLSFINGVLYLYSL